MGFLFEPELRGYLETIRTRLLVVWAVDAQLKILPVGDKRADVAGKQGEGLLWLGNQLAVVPERFAKYLRVGQ